MSKNKRSAKKNPTKKSSSNSSSPKRQIFNTDPFFPKNAISLFDPAGELPKDLRRKKTSIEELNDNRERYRRHLIQKKINEIKMEKALEGLSPLSEMAERFRLENEKLKKKEELEEIPPFPDIPDPKKSKTTIRFPDMDVLKEGGKKANTKHRRQQKSKKTKKSRRTRIKKSRRTRRKKTKM